MSRNTSPAAFHALLVCALFLPLPVLAASPPSQAPLQKALQGINSCVRSSQPGACTDRITASSNELYGKVIRYELMRCIPSDLAYVSQKRVGDHVFVRASTRSLGEQKRYVRFGFVEEEGDWKLDAPESLRAALGEKWQQQVTLTEKLYLVLRAQLGNKVDCESVRGLLQTQG